VGKKFATKDTNHSRVTIDQKHRLTMGLTNQSFGFSLLDILSKKLTNASDGLVGTSESEPGNTLRSITPRGHLELKVLSEDVVHTVRH